VSKGKICSGVAGVAAQRRIPLKILLMRSDHNHSKEEVQWELQVMMSICNDAQDPLFGILFAALQNLTYA
jgi:hypothetical protein